MVQVWWVQIAARATNVAWAVRATRNSPTADCTSAALPTVDSGEPASIASVIPALTWVPFTVGRGGALVGDIGLQPSRIAPNAPPPIVRVTACEQKRRRVSPSPTVSRKRLAVGSFMKAPGATYVPKLLHRNADKSG